MASAVWIGFLPVLLASGAGLASPAVSFTSPLVFQSAANEKTNPEADAFLKKQQRGLANNPRALTFTISLKDNKTRYQQGEIIRVELSFSSSLPKTYRLDGATYDRGGRLNIDSYFIDPQDGAVDPLKDYLLGGMGGLRGISVLDESPHRIVRDLNEYLRFDKPGKYRLYVISNRVEREPGKDEVVAPGRYLVLVPAVSNVIEFEMVPADAKWALNQFQAAISVLESKGGTNAALLDEKKQSAARIIRFLGTEESARYMARHLDEDWSEFHLGLMGSPYAATVLRELESGLDAPDRAVSSAYLYMLTDCYYSLRYSNRPGPYPGTQDKAKLELWLQEENKARAARDELREQYLNRLAAAVFNKQGQAKAVSLNTLLNEAIITKSGKQHQLPASLIERLPSEVAKTFFDLPAESQQGLFLHQWRWLKGPEMMPIPERYYENPTQGKWTDPEAAGIALKRIYELDPARGRELILKEIAHPVGRVSFEVLAMLPDKTLPELNEVFSRSLTELGSGDFERLNLRASLLARYATPDLLPSVRQAQMQRDMDWCATQAPIIAYYLRVEPKLGAAELEQALSPGGAGKSCRGIEILGDVARLYPSPELDKIAIKHLDDPDLGVVLDAVNTLGEYGSVAAEVPLMRRFEKLRDEWKDRAEDMQIRRIEQRPEYGMPLRMESALRLALVRGRGWLADAEKLRQIQALCLTEPERQQVEHAISEAAAPKKRIAFMPMPGDKWKIQVAQYWDLSSLDAVKAKLAQFPRGTLFLWAPFNEGQAEDQKREVLGELKTFLTQLGMSLEVEQPPK